MTPLQTNQLENQARIDQALRELGELTGGPPFALELSPGDAVLDAAVTRENSWAEGLLYGTIGDYLVQLVANLRKAPEQCAGLGGAVPSRVIQFSIDEATGGTTCGTSVIRAGRLEFVFRAQSLKTNQAGWSDIGVDLADALAAAGSVSEQLPSGAAADLPAPPPAPASITTLPAQVPATLATALEALGAFVGDGQPWKVELLGDEAEMDAAVAREASYMAGLLRETVGEFLGFIEGNVRRTASPEELAEASPARTIVFEFIELDDCPRPFKGAFQAVIRGQKLHFVGPADRFRSNAGGAAGIGEDLDKALQAARGEEGPSRREARLAEQLGQIAATSKGSGGGGKGGVCTMCKGRKFRTCTGCHGTGGNCSRCKGSGLSQAKCPSCDGLGTR